jgi:hypothetical protein
MVAAMLEAYDLYKIAGGRYAVHRRATKLHEPTGHAWLLGGCFQETLARQRGVSVPHQPSCSMAVQRSRSPSSSSQLSNGPSVIHRSHINREWIVVRCTPVMFML